MPRYGCFEVRTECDHCGNPVPINGPLRTLRCSYCLESLTLDPSRLAHILGDLLEDHDALAEREGRSGTMMSDRTYKYGYFRLAPRCSECKAALSIDTIASDHDGTLTCGCGRSVRTHPAPAWLTAVVPAAERIYGGELEGEIATAPPPATDPTPIVMACPQCGGGLQLTSENDRVSACRYCNAQVFIPDALWKRLHPVAQVEAWFVRFADAPAPAPRVPEPAPETAFHAEPAAEPDDHDAPTRTAARDLAPVIVVGIVLVAVGAWLAFG